MSPYSFLLRSWPALALFISLLPISLFAAPLPGAPELHDFNTLTSVLQKWERNHTTQVQLIELARSREDRSVWLLEIGAADIAARAQNPAILLAAGLEGDQLAGTEIALAFIETIFNATDTTQVETLLNSTTLYIVPRLNPDAAERYFLSPRREMPWNTTPSDEDHDGFQDEDGPEDLNGDGLITALRVEDPKGTFISHPQEPRLPVEADKSKGETGRWLVRPEGRDNDGDEEKNEDPLGGVNLNRNFPFEYPWFEAHAGVQSVCEAETRALAQFVTMHPNIAVVFTYSALDTLYKTPESGEASPGRDPQLKVRSDDVKWYEQMGDLFRQKLQIEKPLDLNKDPKGTFAAWMYFHKGRLSLSAPVWSPEIANGLVSGLLKEASPEETADTSDETVNDATGAAETKESEKPDEEKKDEDTRAKAEREYLKWLDQNAPGYFVPWQAVENPDDPGQSAEVGGFAPYAKALPPAEAFAKITDSHISFLRELLGKLPRIQLPRVLAKPLGQGIYDLTILVQNQGYLPTLLFHGERTGEVIPTRIEIDLPDSAFLAGRRLNTVGPLGGSGGNYEFHAIVRAGDRNQVTVRVRSALAGQAEQTVSLSTGGASE